MVLIIKDIKKNLTKLKRNVGFTLIELLTSIFIIALISGISLANYRSGERQENLANAAQELAGNIRLAQSYALGMREFAGSFPAGGWGARFAQGASSYIIFADNDIGEYDYDAGEEYRTINLPDKITIDSVTAANPLDIVFLPPNPITYIAAQDDISTNIVLKDSQTGSTKTITVNFLGLVDVVN